MTHIRCLIKFLSWKKKKKNHVKNSLVLFEWKVVWKWEVMWELYATFYLRHNGFGKKKQIKASVRTTLAQESFIVALDWDWLTGRSRKVFRKKQPSLLFETNLSNVNAWTQLLWKLCKGSRGRKMIALLIICKREFFHWIEKNIIFKITTSKFKNQYFLNKKLEIPDNIE